MNKEEMNEKDIPEMTENETTESMPEHDDDIAFEEVNEEGEVDARDTIKKLRTKLKAAEQEAKQNLDGWTRAKADYANFKKEVDARKLDDIKFANIRLLEDMLPALDAYTMAQGNKEAWEKVDANWRTGIEYIFNQLHAVLEKEGLIVFGKEGEAFDPHIHESMEVIPTEEEGKENTLASVLSRGYMLGKYVLRPAKVKVFTRKEH